MSLSCANSQRTSQMASASSYFYRRFVVALEWVPSVARARCDPCIVWLLHLGPEIGELLSTK